jgi:hypothetical protein
MEESARNGNRYAYQMVLTALLSIVYKAPGLVEALTVCSLA